MENKKEDWFIEDNDDYDINELLKYKKLPVSKKIDYLDELNDFLGKLIPKERQAKWDELRRQGF